MSAEAVLAVKTKHCRNCGKPYPSNGFNAQKYCGQECRDEVRRRNQLRWVREKRGQKT